MKQERIDLRANPDVKVLLQRAAAVSNISLSTFLLNSAVDSAHRILAEKENIVLDNIERDRFLTALNTPKEPGEKLKSTMSAYLKQVASRD